MPTGTQRTPPSLARGPTEAQLRATLGRAFALFDRLAHPTPTAAGEWRSYKRDAPPTLKVVEGKRTLYYLRPARGAVHVSLLLTRRACQEVTAAALPPAARAAVTAGEDFPEGRAVRLECRRLADARDVSALVALKLAHR